MSAARVESSDVRRTALATIDTSSSANAARRRLIACGESDRTMIVSARSRAAFRTPAALHRSKEECSSCTSARAAITLAGDLLPSATWCSLRSRQVTRLELAALQPFDVACSSEQRAVVDVPAAQDPRRERDPAQSERRSGDDKQERWEHARAIGAPRRFLITLLVTTSPEAQAGDEARAGNMAAPDNAERRPALSLLVIILIVIVVLALLGFFGRGRF